MKKFMATLVLLTVILSSITPVHGADGKVTYNGNARQFIFEPGTEHAPTDLFPHFKSVMPGDTITQKITIKNDASEQVKVKLYLRSLGAREDSSEFLSQLGLNVHISEDNNAAYMFDAPADNTAQLTDWVYLGTLYSGGEVNLDVTLTVPAELDNGFQNQIGYLDWEFRIEEFPIQPDDPMPPQTGDTTWLGVWIGCFIISAFGMIILLLAKKKSRQ